MAKFKIILSDPETGKSQTIEIEGSRAVPLIGRKLGEIIDGTAIGLGGYKIKITGGSDKDGFPMRPDVHGGVKTRLILTKGVGFHATSKGERRRKTIRGNVITEEITQINMKIIEKPKKKEKAAQPKKAEAKETVEKAETVEKKPEEPKEAKEETSEEKEKPEEAKTGGQSSEETAQTARS
jgi:small subunit ribosomal protein S6e